MRCIVCGDRGTKEGCPKCGKKISNLNIPEPKKEAFITKSRFHEIPDNYIGRIWSKDLLLSNNAGRGGLRFANFVESLDKLHEKFIEGNIYGKSVFISAPSKTSKTVFAYSCMQHALKSGLTVAPLMDTLEAKTLLVNSAYKPEYKIHKFITYDDYITRDILFLAVTKTDYYTDAFTTCLDVMSRRSRMGLPTFIISKFSLKEISQDSVDNNISQLINVQSGEDPLKYPVILEYRDVMY